MRHPNPEMLVRIAQGDAFGMACEYIKFPEHAASYETALEFRGYVPHPVLPVKAGQYTDDTQMSIAVAEVLLEREFTQASFADRFVHCFKRDWRDGYARHFQAFLESVPDGIEFRRQIKADSDKNGAAMRSVPLGVIADTDQLMEVASLQAKLTHNTAGGTLSSQLVALMSHFALYEQADLKNLPEWLAGFIPNTVIPRWDGSQVKDPKTGGAFDGVGMATARAVMTLVSERYSLVDIARTALVWGGDTDSVISIAWGIASCRMKEPPPQFFEDGLENGEYGRDFLRSLGARLMEEYKDG